MAGKGSGALKINLHIERMVLDGLPIETGERQLLQESVKSELTRMLMKNGLSSHLTDSKVLARISAKQMQLGSDDDTTRIGRKIAQSVYGGIGHE